MIRKLNSPIYRVIIMALLTVNLFSSCDVDIFGNDINNFFSHYYLINLENGTTMLSYNDSNDNVYPCIINESVFAVALKNNYIIAKQHPNDDRKITKYFIIPVKYRFDWKTNNGMFGPLTLVEFNKKSKELNLENVEFKIYYKDLDTPYK
jgi:hypothetical protein